MKKPKVVRAWAIYSDIDKDIWPEQIKVGSLGKRELSFRMSNFFMSHRYSIVPVEIRILQNKKSKGKEGSDGHGHKRTR